MQFLISFPLFLDKKWSKSQGLQKDIFAHSPFTRNKNTSRAKPWMSAEPKGIPKHENSPVDAHLVNQ